MRFLLALAAILACGHAFDFNLGVDLSFSSQLDGMLAGQNGKFKEYFEDFIEGIQLARDHLSENSAEKCATFVNATRALINKSKLFAAEAKTVMLAKLDEIQQEMESNFQVVLDKMEAFLDASKAYFTNVWQSLQQEEDLRNAAKNIVVSTWTLISSSFEFGTNVTNENLNTVSSIYHEIKLLMLFFKAFLEAAAREMAYSFINYVLSWMENFPIMAAPVTAGFEEVKNAVLGLLQVLIQILVTVLQAILSVGNVVPDMPNVPGTLPNLSGFPGLPSGFPSIPGMSL